MVETEPVLPPSLTHGPDPSQNTPPPPPPKRRGRRPSGSSDRIRKHVSIPAEYGPAFQQLKNELGLRSEGDAVAWLVRQVRPDLLPTEPLPSPDRGSIPTCVQLPDETLPASSRPPASPSTLGKLVLPPPVLSQCKEMIDVVLDDEVVTSPTGGFRHFLVRWRGRPESNVTWITEEDFRALDPAHLDWYLKANPSKLRSS